MRQWVILAFCLIGFCPSAFSGTGVNPETGRLDLCLTIEETDGSPSNQGCGTVSVSNSSLTDDGDGTYTLSTGGGGGNSFETIDVPAGTDPVADSSTDTLTITETSPLVITGTAATDTIDITWTTLTVAEGGTGATTLTDGGILLGSGTGAITALGVATNGQIPIGDGTTDPVLATLTGVANEVDVTNGAGSITIDLPASVILTTSLTVVSTDPADAGEIRLNNAATIAWEASPAGTDETLTLSSAENFQLSGPLEVDASDPADAEAIRLDNAEGIAWEASPAGTDVTLKVDSTEVLVVSDDFKITGDDLFMTTNTSGAVLVADGTNFNPVVMSGDVTIGTTGVTAIGANKVTDAMLVTTESLNLPIYSAKLTGAFVVRTPTSGDASTQGAALDAADGNWRLLFDPTTDEAAVWQFRLPDYWAAHSELNVFYTMTSATTLEVEFEADVMCVSDGDAADVGTASFAGVAVGSATVPGTAGFPDEISITLTDDACAAGDMMWMYLSKDSNDAVNDDASGDTELIGLEYEFTR